MALWRYDPEIRLPKNRCASQDVFPGRLLHALHALHTLRVTACTLAECLRYTCVTCYRGRWLTKDCVTPALRVTEAAGSHVKSYGARVKTAVKHRHRLRRPRVSASWPRCYEATDLVPSYQFQTSMCVSLPIRYILFQPRSQSTGRLNTSVCGRTARDRSGTRTSTM